MYTVLLQKILDKRFYGTDDGNTYYLNMDCDILVVPDIHIDVKKKRPHYFWEIMSYLDRINELLSGLDNPVVIFCGDIFDKGLNISKGIFYYEQALKRFETMSSITYGRSFTVYGNHEDTYLDVTPTALLMEVSEHLKEVIESNGKELNRNFGYLLKTPKTLRIGNTKISLQHFQKYNKNYSSVEGDCEYHVAVYHDTFVNNTLRNEINHKLPVDRIWKNHMKDLNLRDIDLAIFGDFHIPVPLFRINNRRNTAVIIPGSLGRNNYATETHDSVKLPIIKIRETKEPKILIHDFKLIPYNRSYNMVDKMKSTQDIANNIRKIVGGMRNSSREEISLSKFSSYVNDVYGEEWGVRVYNYIERSKGRM